MLDIPCIRPVSPISTCKIDDLGQVKDSGAYVVKLNEWRCQQLRSLEGSKFCQMDFCVPRVVLSDFRASGPSFQWFPFKILITMQRCFLGTITLPFPVSYQQTNYKSVSLEVTKQRNVSRVVASPLLASGIATLAFLSISKILSQMFILF